MKFDHVDFFVVVFFTPSLAAHACTFNNYMYSGTHM